MGARFGNKAALTVFAIKQVAHSLPACLIRFFGGLAFVGIHTTLGWGLCVFRSAARWTMVGKAGLVRFQFELFRADGANFDGKFHPASMIRPQPYLTPHWTKQKRERRDLFILIPTLACFCCVSDPNRFREVSSGLRRHRTGLIDR